MSLAIIFPGQGSQSVGMLADLPERYPVVREVFAEASEILGYDLYELVQNGPATELDQTEKTQPALLTAGIANWRIWQGLDGTAPSVVAGHSLGEYTALVCAGVLEFTEAVALVADRGRFMQEAVPAGSGIMAAVLGLDDDKVMEICACVGQGETVAAANFNAPGQVVISGHSAAVHRAVTALKEAGAKRVVLLPVSVPSHCALMKGAADKLADRLQQVTFSDAAIPVIQNVDAIARTDADGIMGALIRQLHEPVHWSRTIEKMQATGVAHVIECGPGKVLTGLCRRIDRALDAQAVYDQESLDNALSKELG